MPISVLPLESLVSSKQYGEIELYSTRPILDQQITDAGDVVHPKIKRTGNRSLQLGSAKIDIKDHSEQNLVDERSNHNREPIQKNLYHDYYDHRNDDWDYEKIKMHRVGITIKRAYLRTFNITRVPDKQSHLFYIYLNELL
jgi:hypothetical protein